MINALRCSKLAHALLSRKCLENYLACFSTSCTLAGDFIEN
jgi:hypothetical protein